jgi:hypothetical protein
MSAVVGLIHCEDIARRITALLSRLLAWLPGRLPGLWHSNCRLPIEAVNAMRRDLTGISGISRRAGPDFAQHAVAAE